METAPYIWLKRKDRARWAIYYGAVFLQDRILFVKVDTAKGLFKKQLHFEVETYIYKRTLTGFLEKLPVEAILQLDADNFEIFYSDITSIELEENKFPGDVYIYFPWFRKSGRVTINAKTKLHLEIPMQECYTECVKAFKSFLGEKVKEIYYSLK